MTNVLGAEVKGVVSHFKLNEKKLAAKNVCPPSNIEQWSRAVAPMSSRGGLVLA